jgi:serine/threonine protein kinase/tetratricopeptide (TPR) repeat protein
MAMLCPKCNASNPDDSRFCGNCAAPLHSPDFTETPTLELWAPVRGLARGALFAKRYEVIEDLGEGGMGRIYRVLDRTVNEEIALKLIRPEVAANPRTIARFSNELKIARKISHKNVCRMFHLGEEAGTRYITMEFVDGEDLKNMLKMAKQFSEKATIRIARQVCEGLAEAHRHGVVHRDLKPSNIMIDRDGNVRILDFGIAKNVEAEGMTRTGAMIGTPEYMSPEQVDGREADPRSDIYSLGVVLFEMMTGQLPFAGDNPLSIAIQHKTKSPPEPAGLNSEISVDMNRIILKCLEKSPEKRYPSAEALRNDLIQLEKLVSDEKAVLGTRKTIKGVRFLGKWQPWAVFVLAVVVVVAGAFFVRRKKETPSPAGIIHTLAVLPFENLGTTGDEYFADGISEEITNRLAGLHGLSVISRTSALQYKKTVKTAKQIGEELGVDYILEGTVRWDRTPSDKGRVRVTPKLVRTADTTQIWSKTYDQVLEDTFSLQSEIAEAVTKELDITLLAPERQALSAHPTKNAEAYDLLLKARRLMDEAYTKLDPNTLDDAAQKLETAIQLDPGFTQAFLALFSCHDLYYVSGFDRSQSRLVKAKAALDRALELEPDSPQARISLGLYYYRAFQDFDRASQIFESVQREYPNSIPPEILGYIQRRQGKWEKALTTLENGFKLNPRSIDTASQIAITYLAMRRFEQADAWYARALQVNPAFLNAKLGRAELSYFSRGETKEARALIESILADSIPVSSRLALEFYERRLDDALKTIAAMPGDTIDGPQSYTNRDLLRAFIFWAKKDWTRMKKHAELARLVLEKTLGEHPGDPRIYAALGRASAYLGLKAEAIRLGKQSLALCPLTKDALDAPVYIQDLAAIYTIVGEYEEAINQLEYLLSIPAGLVATSSLFRLDAQWDPLRDHPRFRRLTATK